MSCHRRARSDFPVGVKLQILSDLHLEFGPADLATTDADVIVLAGDIAPGLAGWELAQTIFPGHPVVYVAGNHEYYGQALPQLTEDLKRATQGSHVHFLDNQEVVLQGARFLGCTLWTDFRVLGEAMQQEAQEIAAVCMNDYRVVKDSRTDSPLRPDATRALHLESRAWLEQALATPFNGPTVVVTHHAPSLRSIDPLFRGDPVSAAYASNLESLMGQERVVLWVHGHTHRSTHYDVKGTQVVSNQRGYPEQRHTGFKPGLVMEV